MRQICFVCTGNTCRSPMAAAVANAFAQRDAELSRPTAISAGIYAQEGEGISRLAAEALKERALLTPTVLSHLSHTVTEQEARDCVLVGMTKAHAAMLRERFGHLTNRIYAFPREITDPYGQGIEAYRACLTEIINGMGQLLENVLSATAEAPAFEIFPIAEAHLEAVAEIERLCFAEPWSAQALRLLLGEDACGFVALSHGRVCAYGGMLLAPNEGQITNIAVHPDIRRQGMGAAILSALLEAARARALAEVFLEVRVSNQAAIALYRANGIEAVGERRNFYRHPTENALVMRCTLQDRSTT